MENIPSYSMQRALLCADHISKAMVLAQSISDEGFEILMNQLLVLNVFSSDQNEVVIVRSFAQEARDDMERED